VLWSIFERIRARLETEGLLTQAALLSRLALQLRDRNHPPFEFAVVDEAQDIGVGQLRFLAALGGGRPNALFFAGDLGQRIFQQPFSWKSLGVDIRGRSRTLRVNYRTSHQIRRQADLEEVYNTERHLLYVACTRARDHLLVTGVDPASEFLDDLRV